MGPENSGRVLEYLSVIAGKRLASQPPNFRVPRTSAEIQEFLQKLGTGQFPFKLSYALLLFGFCDIGECQTYFFQLIGGYFANIVSKSRCV